VYIDIASSILCLLIRNNTRRLGSRHRSACEAQNISTLLRIYVYIHIYILLKYAAAGDREACHYRFTSISKWISFTSLQNRILNNCTNDVFEVETTHVLCYNCRSVLEGFIFECPLELRGQ